MSFDPDAAASPGSGIFGLPCTPEESRVVLYPVPFDATTSYRRGTSQGPASIKEASFQVDLLDRRFGRIYERGICMVEESAQVRALSASAGAAAAPLIAGGGTTGDPGTDSKILAVVAQACEQVNDIVYNHTARVLRDGKVPGLIGGEHSVPFGAIQACAEHQEGLGILHIDAHMDLREAFEGFEWSHASIMHNVIRKIPGVTRLVQVGIRDFGERELALAMSEEPRIKVCFDDDWAERALNGIPFASLCASAIEALPRRVYVSFDIDGLDPSLCPHTGTPVPGGLSFNQAALLLEALKRSGREVVGFDLVEVAPGPEGSPEWDANVGARVLYKLCGLS